MKVSPRSGRHDALSKHRVLAFPSFNRNERESDFYCQPLGLRNLLAVKPGSGQVCAREKERERDGKGQYFAIVFLERNLERALTRLTSRGIN